jgi:hypothetical protein
MPQCQYSDSDHTPADGMAILEHIALHTCILLQCCKVTEMHVCSGKGSTWTMM